MLYRIPALYALALSPTVFMREHKNKTLYGVRWACVIDLPRGVNATRR